MMKPMLCALALMICLTGCAVQEALPDGSAAPAAEDESLLVIDGKEVPAWRYFCWLDRGLSALEGEHTAADFDAVKAQALSDTALYAAVETMAEEQGVTLTEEERAALTPGVWAELPEEQWRELAAVGALYGKLCSLDIPRETLAAFGAEQGYRTVDRILIPAGEGAAERAAEVFARLNGGGEEAFNAAKGESADTLGPRTFLPGDGVLDPTLEAAAAALTEGQLSGILESEEGFSILYCLPLDAEQLRIPWLDAALQKKAAGAEVQSLPGYESLDISARYRLISDGNVEKKEAASSS